MDEEFDWQRYYYEMVASEEEIINDPNFINNNN